MQKFTVTFMILLNNHFSIIWLLLRSDPRTYGKESMRDFCLPLSQSLPLLAGGGEKDNGSLARNHSFYSNAKIRFPLPRHGERD
jgi:hypothetical protein